MATLTIIDIPVSDWEDEGFYNPVFNILAIREDVSEEKKTRTNCKI